MSDKPVLHREGAGPPLVLIHGLGLDHQCWQTAARALARDFTVITYDLPGHGTRRVPKPYAIESLAEELAAALDSADVAKAHIAGFSLGGLVAQAFAATKPERVERLILIDTTPSYPADWQKIWAERAATARTQGTKVLVEGVLKTWFTPAFAAAGGPVVQLARQVLENTPDEGYALGCEALAAAKLEPLTATITRSTLIMCGEDEGPHFHDAVAWFNKTIAGSSLEWMPGKHAAIFESPDLFVSKLTSFLAG